MKSTETTVGYITTKENAAKTASNWNNPAMGYHAQAVKKGHGYICRVVINR